MHSKLTPILIVLALPLSGCFWFTSKHEGRQLRDDVDRLDTVVKTDVSTKVEKLQAVLDEATKLLKRNSADLGAEVDGLVQDNAKLAGLVMEAKRISETVKQANQEQIERLNDLEKRLATLEEKVMQVPQKSPEQLFAEAKALFDARSYVQARGIFKEIVVKHGTTAIAAEAQWFRAETHFKQDEWKSAIGEYTKIYDNFKNSRRVDEAFYRMAECAEKLSWCTDARAYYGLILKKFPRSSLIRRAKGRIAAIKKLPKKRCAR